MDINVNGQHIFSRVTSSPGHLFTKKESKKRGKFVCERIQFVIFNPLSYCFEGAVGFDLKVSFASRPGSHLIR